MYLCCIQAGWRNKARGDGCVKPSVPCVASSCEDGGHSEEEGGGMEVDGGV